MKTIDTFRYALNFRNLAGGSRSFDDLQALRDILAEEAQRQSAMLGAAVSITAADGKLDLAAELDHHKGWIVGLIESDIMAIDAFLASRNK